MIGHEIKVKYGTTLFADLNKKFIPDLMNACTALGAKLVYYLNTYDY